MSKSTLFDGRQSFDLTSSRVVRLWLGLEILLTLISFILVFFLPKTAGGLLLVIFCASVITLGACGFLFIRYNSLPEVKNKRTFLSEKNRLLTKVTKTKMELAKVEQALATNQTNENQEIEKSLQKIHREYFENGLRAAKIDSGNIPGVGSKLKEKLKYNRITSAADIGTHIQNLEGFGDAKVQALMRWKEYILFQLESTKPQQIPDTQLSEIQQKYRRQRDNLVKTRESHQVQQTELDLELGTVNRNLSHFKGINFINYLGTNLLDGNNNKILQKGKTAILLSVIGLGALIHGTFGVVSTGSLITASIPTPTLTYTPTLTFKITSTSTITHTPTQKPTSTITLTLTATITPTITLTPLMTPTPTEDLSFYNVAACIPKNTLIQRGIVTNIIDGDTIDVRLEDGNSYSLRLIGIDSPESGQPFFAEARNAISDLVFQKEVILIKDVSDVDQYRRLLRYVIVGNIFVNDELVRTGFASAFRYPPDVACSTTFSNAEQYAKTNLLGLWVPMPPSRLATPVDIPTCSCSYNQYNCSDFSSHSQAQACYEYCISLGAGDVHRLDGDSNGSACESLP
jgi:endonuclease YncB( thermonuclease family)